jgi:hypothetical protein
VDEDKASVGAGNTNPRADNGSSVAETDTNEPSSESDPKVSRRSRWYDRGREYVIGSTGSASIGSSVGDARGVAGEKRVANLSMLMLASVLALLPCDGP